PPPDAPPPVRGRQGRGLRDPHAVTDTGGVGLVMNLDALGAAHDLAVQRVLHPVLEFDDDGLGHLVGHDVPDPHLAAVALGGVGHYSFLLTHWASPGAARSEEHTSELQSRFDLV